MICSITLLHKLPNRIRVKLSRNLKTPEKVENIIHEEENIEEYRYNPVTNTIVIKYRFSHRKFEQVMARLIAAVSVDNNLDHVRVFEKPETRSLSEWVFYSGFSILGAGAYSLNPFSTNTTIQNSLNILAASTTGGAVVDHAWKEMKEKDSFDPEVIVIFYLVQQVLKGNYIYSSAVTWLGTFGRHLFGINKEGKEYKITRLRDCETGKFIYDVTIYRHKNVSNYHEHIEKVFSKFTSGNKEPEMKYCVMKVK